MFGEMLMTGRVASPERQRQYIETICRESERLSGLIENVLDFAALERRQERYRARGRLSPRSWARAWRRCRLRPEGRGDAPARAAARADVNVDARRCSWR
jgi:two-component system phosphate regulon sensor histidine kinase PhoR